MQVCSFPPARRSAGDDVRATYEKIDQAASAAILNPDLWPQPVKITSMELLRNRRNFLVRVRTADGAEGISVPNAMHFVHTYPIFVNRVAPFFVGKDARGLEGLHWELYRHADNYKYQGLALWVCAAGAEFAVLDLLGKLSGKSIGDLLGGVKRREIAVYRASGTRGNTPEAEIEDLKKIVAESGARALKFRLGGRMRDDNADSLPRPHRKADSAGARDLWQRDDALCRLEQLLRCSQGHRDRPVDGRI